MDSEKLIINDIYKNKLSKHNYIEKKQTSCRIKVLFLLPILLFLSIYILPSNTLADPRRLILIIFLSFITLSIVTLFWYEDLIHLERNRITQLSNAYKLEQQYKWLPRFIHTTLIYRKRFDSPNQKVLQYIVIGSIILVGTGVALFFLTTTYIGAYAYLISLPIVISIIAYSFFLRRISGSFEKVFKNR